MIAEAIDRICNLVKEEKNTRVIMPPSEPSHVYYFGCGDDFSRVEAEPKPRAHQVRDLLTICEFCENNDASQDPAEIAVWYSRAGIVAFLDDGTRRDKLEFSLKVSPQMAVLEGWARGIVWLDQASLVRALRTTFAYAFLGNTAMLAAFRQLKFRQSAQGEKIVEHGRSSIGKSLEAELTGSSSVPEDILFHVHAFDGDTLRISASIHTVVEIDPAAEKIAIIPQAGQIEKAWSEVEDDIGAKLRNCLDGINHVHIYRGTP